MAFEAYLQQDRASPRRRRRRLTFTLSMIAHAVLLAVAVGYSFWHVEELVPPAVTVMLLSAAAIPPPPPPPPPLGGSVQAPKHKVVRPKVEVTPRPTELVQPKEPEKETPKEEPKTEPAKTEPATTEGTADGVAGGVKGGVAGGVKGGVVGGTIGAPVKPAAPAPRFVPPQLAAKQLVYAPEPDVPAQLLTRGANYKVGVKICVGGGGELLSATMMKGAHPTLDANVMAAVKQYRFKPMTANGAGVPFCYVRIFDFRIE